MDPAVMRSVLKSNRLGPFDKTGATYGQRRAIISSAVDQLGKFLSEFIGNKKTVLWFSGRHRRRHLPAPAITPSPKCTSCSATGSDARQQHRIDSYRYPPQGRFTTGLARAVTCPFAWSSLERSEDPCRFRFALLHHLRSPSNPALERPLSQNQGERHSNRTPWRDPDYRPGYYGRPDDGSVSSSVVPRRLRPARRIPPSSKPWPWVRPNPTPLFSKLLQRPATTSSTTLPAPPIPWELPAPRSPHSGLSRTRSPLRRALHRCNSSSRRTKPTLARKTSGRRRPLRFGGPPRQLQEVHCLRRLHWPRRPAPAEGHRHRRHRHANPRQRKLLPPARRPRCRHRQGGRPRNPHRTNHAPKEVNSALPRSTTQPPPYIIIRNLP